MIFRNTRYVVYIFLLQSAVMFSLTNAEITLNVNHQSVDLLQKYPIILSTGCDEHSKAWKWKFTKEDIFFCSGFQYEINDTLKICIGPADVGIGYCQEGATFAIVVPRENGTLISSASDNPENIKHLWLRYPPQQITQLFPESSIYFSGNHDLWAKMQKIATSKIYGSWQAGGDVLIPYPSCFTVDADCTNGKRRFFSVDLNKNSVKYVKEFQDKSVQDNDILLTQGMAEEAFDMLWKEYDRNYAMFAIKPDVDWNELRAQYRPKAIECQNSYEFALVCSEMLSHLHDLHIWVSVDGQNVPVFNRPRERNANPSARKAIIGQVEKTSDSINWGKTQDKVGYIAIDIWKDNVDEQFDEVLEDMRDTRGLIIDVRLNGGGGEPLAQNVAGRFADKEYIYACSQYRNGPKHTDLTEKYPRTLRPRGPWRYNRPVIVLMGQKCMSSNESFVAMMGECPQVTTMGDYTCGSSGNPKFINLPGKIRISLPQWIDFLPDGAPLEERGVQPDVNFPTKSEFFEDKSDGLLTKAVEKLIKLSLPETEISGPDIRIIRSQEKASRPSVLQIFPEDNATNVDPDTEIRIKYDRSMDPLVTELKWETGNLVKFRNFHYDKKNNEFVFSVELQADSQHIIHINRNVDSDINPKGFQDHDGNSANSFKWTFHTKSFALSPEKEKPKIVSIFPTPNSTLPLVSELKVRFNQPMLPNKFNISDPENQGQDESCFAFVHQITYNQDDYTFTIPFLLPPSWRGFVKLDGFKSTSGVGAEPTTIKYNAGQELLSANVAKRLERAKKSDVLYKTLKGILETHLKLTGASEMVIETTIWKNGINSDYGNFKRQGNERFYADVSKIMGRKYTIGSDGLRCWYHIKYKDYTEDKIVEKLIVLPYKDIHEKTVLICDPFKITEIGIENAIEQYHLEYIGTDELNSHKCHLIRSWHIEQTPEQKRFNITRCRVGSWWFDEQSYRLLRIEDDRGGFSTITQFVYEENENSFENHDFSPPQITNVVSDEPEPLNDEYNHRFLKAIDGSDGRMSVRWGRFGDVKRISSGLN